MPRRPTLLGQIYQFKITLKDSKPPIWRRVEVPDTVTLAQLHQIIQAAMGWYDSHLHQFTRRFIRPVIGQRPAYKPLTQITH